MSTSRAHSSNTSTPTNTPVRAATARPRAEAVEVPGGEHQHGPTRDPEHEQEDAAEPIEAELGMDPACEARAHRLAAPEHEATGNPEQRRTDRLQEHRLPHGARRARHDGAGEQQCDPCDAREGGHSDVSSSSSIWRASSVRPMMPLASSSNAKTSSSVDAVVHARADAAALDEPDSPQCRELLRRAPRIEAELRLQRADGALTSAQQLKDPDAGGMSEGPEEVRFGGRGKAGPMGQFNNSDKSKIRRF